MSSSNTRWIKLCLLLMFVGISFVTLAETPAERGYRLLRSKPYLQRDLTEEMLDSLWTVWPEPDRSEAEKLAPHERRRLLFKRYGLVEIDDPYTALNKDPASTLPDAISYVRAEEGFLVMNCLACHAGSVAGKPIAGLGNNSLAFQTLSDDVTRLRLKRGQNVMTSLVGNFFTPLGMSNGTTNAQIFSVQLSHLRDKDLNFVPPRTMPKGQHHDLDAPPFWNTKKKKHLYIDGFVEKSPRVIMQFVLVPGNKGEMIRSWEPDFQDVLAWIESVTPPKYPWKIDESRARRGETVFRKNCSSCHGTYGDNPTYPEVTVPIEEIGTDSRRLTGMPISHRQFYADSWFGEYGKRKVVSNPAGYVAPPLDGIWASAPYFHNGSVPTLWHLLHADKRPKVWTRSAKDYSVEKVGLDVIELDSVPLSAIRPDQKRVYFDTNLPGKLNRGHLFPEPLPEKEKDDLLEYLKTL